MPISVAPIPLVGPATGSDDVTDQSVAFNVSSPYAVASARSLSVIVPGESVVGRDTRLAAEAAARAEAEAKSKALQQQQQARTTIARSGRSAEPTDFSEIYNRAEQAFGVDARLLRAIHYVETGGSGSTSRQSSAGAMGPMQFIPSTWRRYATDANGDGSADITNVEDSIYTAAKYLVASGYPDVRKALWSYNPSSAYYNKVMSVAGSLGM